MCTGDKVERTKSKGDWRRIQALLCRERTKRNGVGVILSPGLKDGVLQVTRMSDRIIWVQLELEKEPVNVISAYAPQVGCNEEEKEEFWNLLGGLVAKILEKDTVWIGADLNGHVGVGNQDASKAIGKYGVGERNDSGDRIVEFAMANELAVVNTYFKKRSSRCITYASGGKEAQMDYILCRRRELKTVQDCKVLPNEAVAKQHQLVISKLELETKCRRKERRTRKTRWWKLNGDEHHKEFVRKVEEELDQGQLEEDVPWEVVSNVLRIAAKETLGETSGKAGRKEETWWWNEEVQKAVEKKKEKKRMRDLNRCEKTIEEYKKANKEAKKAVAIAKEAVYKDLYKSLEGAEGEKRAIRIAKQKNRESQDVYQVKLIKNADGNILTDEGEIKERWRSYFENLMNIENERERRMIEPSKETEVPQVDEEEVKTAMKKMKRGKAVGTDNITIEAWRVIGGKGIEILTDVFRQVMTKEKMPDEWRNSTLIPIFKNKGDIQDCGNYRGIKLTSHTLKLWERIIDQRLREKGKISEQQFGFMPGKSTADAIFALRQLMEKYREGQKNLHCVFIDLEKAYDRVPREEVWNCLRLKKVDEKYIRLVQDMYEGSKTRVRCAAGDTEDFRVTVGLHQGSALSPFLFAVIIDCITADIQREAPQDMLFADDVILCADIREELGTRLETWRGVMEDRGMRVSRKKMEYLCLEIQKEAGMVKMQGEELNRVEEFKYLGSTVQADGGAEKEVVKRVQAGWRAWKKVTGIMCVTGLCRIR